MHSPHMIFKSTSVSLLFVFAISGLLMPGFDNAFGQDREPNKATLDLFLHTRVDGTPVYFPRLSTVVRE
jgi:hypothetical protein